MKQAYQDYMMEQMQALLAIDSPSGYTQAAEEYVFGELARLGLSPSAPAKGGVTARVGGGEGPGILLLAHLDTLGAMVKEIKPNGRLKVVKVGGLQANNVETASVRVRTRFDGVYEGTFQLENASAHVNPTGVSTLVRDFDKNMEVVLDEDVRTAADTKKLGIRPGDYVCLEPQFTVTKSGYVKSRFLDDKASAAILLAFAKSVLDEKLALPRPVWIGFTTYEEVGHGGAAGIPEGVSEIMSVDMGCVGDGVTCTEKEVSICARDAAGPYHYGCTTALLKAAIDNNIPHAIDVYTNYSSDVDVSLKAGHDVRHCLIGPGVYASHGYERTHMDGLGATFDLLRAYLL